MPKPKPLTHAQRGALGAAKRNKRLSKKRRKEIATAAAKARWEKHQPQPSRTLNA